MKTLNLNQIFKLPERVKLPISKSIANRWQILKALFPEQIELSNYTDVEDTLVLKSALMGLEDSSINVGHAGTAMRFLCAFLATQKNERFILSGSDRMHQRPMAPLVENLRALGAEINYVEKKGFPPLEIIGRDLVSNSLEIDSSISSQYISALLLIGAKIKGGLHLHLKNPTVSSSYIKLTLDVLKTAGIQFEKGKDSIRVFEQNKLPQKIKISVEPDWSAAAFWYGMVALLPNSKVTLLGLELNSVQGDKKLIDYYECFGVRTKIVDEGVKIYKLENVLPDFLRLNLLDQPDLAQPIAVTCATLCVHVKLTGLQTLAIKETHRLKALQNELLNFGIDSVIDENSIEILPQKIKSPHREVRTYNDHRMAMSFAMLSTMFQVGIENPKVVKKSYPGFWEELV